MDYEKNRMHPEKRFYGIMLVRKVILQLLFNELEYENCKKFLLLGENIEINTLNWKQVTDILSSELYDLNLFNIDLNTHDVLYIMDELQTSGGYEVYI